MSNSLDTFIAHARSKNMDHQTIRMLLLSAGWKEKDIAAALASEALDMPVPAPVDGGSAKDAFLHLLVTTTLYSTVISLIILTFEYINRLLPDTAITDYAYLTNDYSSIRWSIAVILVSFPIFALLSRMLHREFLSQPEKLASGVRRWLTYFTLFITACVLIGDVITLLFSLLNGELTLRFVLKVFSILVLTGMPFLYFFSVLRMDYKQYGKSGLHRSFLILSSVITAALVLYGIVLVGSPTQSRVERFDEQRVNDLRSIQSEIYNQVYGSIPQKPEEKVLPKPLPKTLEEVAKNATYQKLRLTDPVTEESYTYRPRVTTFELCATFSLSRDQSIDIFWNHPAGLHCFQFDALNLSRSF